MKRVVLVIVLLLTIQLNSYAWPNNLIFTLKPTNVELLENVKTNYPLIKEKDGHTYIGKFIHPDIAKMAQIELEKLGINTEVLAFFRARPLPMEDALTLTENFNNVEENTMLSGTKVSKYGGVTVSKAKDVNEAYFTIQLGVFSKSVKDKFQSEVSEVFLNGKYYYFYGKYGSSDKGNKQLTEMVNNGHKDAFLTGFSLGQKVSADLLEKMLKI
jgi:hypothetical protein